MEVQPVSNQIQEISNVISSMSDIEKCTYLEALPPNQKTAYFESLPKIEYMRIIEMMAQARHHKNKASRKNTAKTYKNAAILFNDFCDYLGAAPMLEIDPVKGAHVLQQISPNQMLSFIEHLAQHGNPIKSKGPYKHNSIKTYCLALASLHTEINAGSPMSKTAYERLKEIKEAAPTPKQATPIRQRHIIAAIQQLDVSTNKGKRDKLLLLVGFLGGFRRSELASLDFKKNEKNNYIYIDSSKNTERLVIVLQDHKTSKSTKTHTRTIEASIIDSNICPVKSFRDWEACTNSKGKIFKSVNKKTDKIHKTNLNGEGIDKIIRNTINDPAHPDKAFSAHSLRVGLACELYRNGATLDKIKQHQNWKTYAMIEHYIKELPTAEASPVGLLKLIYKQAA